MCRGGKIRRLRASLAWVTVSKNKQSEKPNNVNNNKTQAKMKQNKKILPLVLVPRHCESF